MSNDFFSFSDASKKVNGKLLPEDLDGPMDGSQEAMDKSILLYHHMLKCVKERYTARHKEGMINLLSACRIANGKYIAREEAEFFVNSIQDETLWKQVADFYWSLCVIQYKIMGELKLLTNLDHVMFNSDGSIKGVKNIYGRADKDGRELLGITLGILVMNYFHDHMEEYRRTLSLVKANAKLSDDVAKHMDHWGHCLLAYLSVMMFGGGIINYNKFVQFCQDYNIVGDTAPADIYLNAIEAFGIDSNG